MKDVINLIAFLRVEELELPGLQLLEEGKLCDKVIIVKSGEFEITKRKFSDVYMNTISGKIQINYENSKAVTSKCVQET